MKPNKVKRHNSTILHWKMWEALSKQGLSYPQEVTDKYEFIVDYLYNHEIVFPIKMIRKLNARVYERLVNNNEKRPNAPVHYLLKDDFVRGWELDFDEISSDYKRSVELGKEFDEWVKKGINVNGS